MCVCVCVCVCMCVCVCVYVCVCVSYTLPISQSDCLRLALHSRMECAQRCDCSLQWNKGKLLQLVRYRCISYSSQWFFWVYGMSLCNDLLLSNLQFTFEYNWTLIQIKPCGYNATALYKLKSQYLEFKLVSMKPTLNIFQIFTRSFQFQNFSQMCVRRISVTFSCVHRFLSSYNYDFWINFWDFIKWWSLKSHLGHICLKWWIILSFLGTKIWRTSIYWPIRSLSRKYWFYSDSKMISHSF